MEKDKLLDSLAHYGYALMRPAELSQPEDLLREVLSQDDARLLEGFPVVFFNVLKEKDCLDWESAKWNPQEKLTGREVKRLRYLLSLTFLLFQFLGVEKKYQQRVLKLLKKLQGSKGTLKKLEGEFLSSDSLAMDHFTLSTERLKNNFHNYLASEQREAREVEGKRHVLELELLLSELFTPKQKELLKKRLEGKTMSKTEKEYFYRVVKKRLKALANDELHQMARKVVYS